MRAKSMEGCSQLKDRMAEPAKVSPVVSASQSEGVQFWIMHEGQVDAYFLAVSMSA